MNAQQVTPMTYPNMMLDVLFAGRNKPETETANDIDVCGSCGQAHTEHDQDCEVIMAMNSGLDWEWEESEVA